MDEIVVDTLADFHVHLRQGDMCKAVVPQIQKGGVSTVLVMVLLEHCFPTLA